MFKYLLFIGTTATVGIITWRALNEVSSRPPAKSPTANEQKINAVAPVDRAKPSIAESTSANTLKNAELHDAFARILDKEKRNRKPAKKRLTIDQLIELHLKTGSTAMTGEERKSVIKKIKLDIKNLEKQYANTDETVDENQIEAIIGHRREQLETFENIELQFPGVNFEN